MTVAAPTLNPCARILPVDADDGPSFLVDAPVPPGGLRRTFVSGTSASGAHRFLLRAAAAATTGTIEVRDDEIGDLCSIGLLVEPESRPEPVAFSVPLAAGAEGTSALEVNPDIRIEDAHGNPPGQPAWAHGRFARDGRVAWAADPVRGLPFCTWLEPEDERVLRDLVDGATSPAALDPGRRTAFAAAGLLVDPRGLRAEQARWRETLHAAAASLAAAGYAILRDLLPPPVADAVRRYYDDAIDQGFLIAAEPYLFGHHNEPLAVWLHHHLTSLVARVVAAPVKPSYAFVAVYGEGGELQRHTDRAQCEYTLSIAAGARTPSGGQTVWPLYLDTAGGRVEARLAVGDAVLFKGREIPHFREPLVGAVTSTSLLVHYVPEGFDGRLD